MEKKYDVVALGEFLIDFTPAGNTDSGMKLFETESRRCSGEHANSSRQGRA